MERFLYEAKPLVMLAVGVLSLIQINDKSSAFEISGYILITAAAWILFARIKYRRSRESSKEETQTAD